MAYELSEDEQLIQKFVAEFARDVVGLEAAHDRDRHDTFPTEVLAAASGLGLTSMALSAEEGGAGVTPTSYALALLEVAKVDPSVSALLATHNGIVLRILRHAKDELKTRVLPGLIAGEFGAYLATEEAGGVSKAKLTTIATPAKGGYKLEGAKTWGLGAAGAKHFVVLAEVTGKGPTWFYFAAGSEGVSLGRNEPLMGLRAAGIRTVYLDDVFIPETDRIGDEGSGRTLLAEVQPWLQVGATAAIVGAIAGAEAAAIEFADHRIQFGKPIAAFQAVSDNVTNLDTQRAAARALLLEAAAALSDDEKAPIAAARAKLFASEIAAPMTRAAIRIQGGTGFMREGGTERFARDVRCLYFVGEPPSMQKDLIKRELLATDFGPTP